MIRVAIVDDDRDYAAFMKRKMVSENWQGAVEAEVFYSAQNFLYSLEDGERYDLCLSDIEMPEISGIELAERVKKIDDHIIVVFLTSYPQYAIQGYRVDVYDYILKERFEEDWGRLFERLQKELHERDERSYLIEMPNRFEKIWLKEILYIHKDCKNVVFVLKDREVEQRISLWRVQEKLKDARQFIMVERAYIVNIDEIRSMEKREIEMSNGFKVPVGKLRIAEIKSRIHSYYAERLKKCCG